MELAHVAALPTICYSLQQSDGILMSSDSLLVFSVELKCERCNAASEQLLERVIVCGRCHFSFHEKQESILCEVETGYPSAF